jgi:hypothetical protein
MYTGSLATVSNTATWQFARTLKDDETDENVIIDDCIVTVTVREQNNGSQRLVASSEDGSIFFPEEGVFQWKFTVAQMQTLCPGTYDVGVRISDKDKEVTEPLIVGTITVIDGIDRQ